jgi:RNA polymerase sigma-32 factor
VAPALYLASAGSDPAEALEADDWEDAGAARLHAALATLDERSRAILEARFLGDGKVTLQALAARFKVSAERIRQIEAGALKTLKAALAA